MAKRKDGTTGYSWGGKFYAYGSPDMPQELLDTLAERGLDPNGLSFVVKAAPVQVQAEAETAPTSRKTKGKGK